MHIFVDENPNCATDERVFSNSGPVQTVHQIEARSPSGLETWWDVTGVEENGVFIPAQAVRVEDSSDGTAWLVFGGAWGLRFKPIASDKTSWSLQERTQWGAPFILLDSSSRSIRFQ